MKGIKIEKHIGASVGRHSEVPPNAKKDSIWDRDIRLGPPLGMKDKQSLYQMLAVLLESGLGILDCLEVLIDQSKKKAHTQLLEDIQVELQAGKSLSESIEAKPSYFNAFEIHSLKMGEETGRMAYVLKSLATFYEKRIKLKRKVLQAFSYPISVIVIAVLVLAFMIGKVVPMFKDIFDRFDTDLPPITQTILSLSDFFRDNFGYLLLGTIILGLGLFRLNKLEVFRAFRSAVLLRIPIIGKVILKLQLSRFCYAFALLLKSKVNLDQALALLQSTVTFYPIQKILPKIRQEVVEGETLYQSIKPYRIFPSFFTQIIRVGEKTARLDEMLEKLAQNLEEESEAGVNQLTQFLEPLLIIILGLMVAVILVAMYLPMFELSQAIG